MESFTAKKDYISAGRGQTVEMWTATYACSLHSLAFIIAPAVIKVGDSG